ncbi:MAG: RsmE family RNA methyltransferase [Myxococcota bacterium]
MRKIRIFCESIPDKDFIELDRENAHYLIDVLRLRQGVSIEVLTPDGSLYEGYLVKGKGNYLLRGLTSRRKEITKGPIINLFVGAIKGGTFDYALEKASELGAYSITPVICEYSSLRNISAERIKRFTKIARSSALQCRRVRPLIVNDAIPIDEILNKRLDGSNIFLDPFEECKLLPSNLDFDNPINIFSGPEGGFSRDEIVKFREKSFYGMSLNTYILRAETIPLVICSIILYEYARRV